MNVLKAIMSTSVELQSGLSRQRQAENLIIQLPDTHDGRNTWLLNYGTGAEAIERRKARDLNFITSRQAAESRNSQLSRASN